MEPFKTHFEFILRSWQYVSVLMPRFWPFNMPDCVKKSEKGISLFERKTALCMQKAAGG